jgi:hypothetical protein
MKSKMIVTALSLILILCVAQEACSFGSPSPVAPTEQVQPLRSTPCGKAVVDYVLKRFQVEPKLTTDYQRISNEPTASLQQLRLVFEEHGLYVSSHKIENSSRGRRTLAGLLGQCGDGPMQAVLLVPDRRTDDKMTGHYLYVSKSNGELLEVLDPATGLSYTVDFVRLHHPGFEPVVQLISLPVPIWQRSLGCGESLVLTLTFIAFAGATLVLLAKGARNRIGKSVYASPNNVGN